MFIGHAAVALAGKRAATRTSLGVLFAAATWMDLAWLVLLVSSWMRGPDGNRADSTLWWLLSPYSQTLAGALGWALAAGAVYYAVTRYRAGAWTVGVLVLSQWVLDWLTLWPSAALWPGGPRVGIEILHSRLSLVGEALMCAAGLAIYVGTTRPRDAAGRWPFWAMVVSYVALYAVALANRIPGDDPTIVTMIALSAWIFPLWAGWADRHREITPQIPETAYGAVERPVA